MLLRTSATRLLPHERGRLDSPPYVRAAPSHLSRRPERNERAECGDPGEIESLAIQEAANIAKWVYCTPYSVRAGSHVPNRMPPAVWVAAICQRSIVPDVPGGAPEQLRSEPIERRNDKSK